MQLTQQVIGLDSVPDAKFIKIEKKGGSLKDLTHTQKKKNKRPNQIKRVHIGSLEQLLSSYNHHNAH